MTQIFAYTKNLYPASNVAQSAELINNFVGELFELKPLIFSPKSVHLLLILFSKAENPTSRLLERSILGHVPLQSLQKVPQDLFQSMKKFGISSPANPNYDLSRIIQVSKYLSDLNNTHKKILKRLLETNLLFIENKGDEYYLKNIEIIKSEDLELCSKSNSGLNAQRYGGGIYKYNGQKYFFKFAEVKHQVISEFFSLKCAEILGITTANPNLIAVKDENNISLGIKSDFIEDIKTIVNDNNPLKIIDKFIKDNLEQSILLVIHMILFKNRDALSRGFKNLHVDKNNKFIMLDASGSLCFRGMGELKDMDLDKSFSENSIDDLLSFKDKESNFSKSTFINIIQNYFNQNPLKKENYTELAENKIDKLINYIQQNNLNIDDEFKKEFFPKIEKRAEQLKENLNLIL